MVFGKYATFVVAAVAAMPYHSMWSTVLGCAVGYLLPSQVSVPVHYIAAILAAAAIRWTMNDLVRVRQHPAFAPMTAFLPMLCTGMALAFVNGSTPSGRRCMRNRFWRAAQPTFLRMRAQRLVPAGAPPG
ncbi:MAG: hypothetical protein ACLS8R_05975 [Anaeromassilibacillus sp.]